MGSKVALWNQLSRYVVIDPAATKGAQVGVNLLAPDGSIVKWDDILNVGTSTTGTLDTTDDLDEGTFNFYFTADRFYGSLKTDLVGSSNVSVTFDDSGQTATVDLTDVSPVVSGTLSRWSFDSKGRMSGMNSASTSDLPEGTNLYYTALRIQKGSETFAIAAGTVNALTAAFTPAITALTDGMQLKVRALLANTTTTPTLSVNGLTARTITKNGGQALAAADIFGAGHELLLRWDNATTHWELLNPAASGGSAAPTRTTITANSPTGGRVTGTLAMGAVVRLLHLSGDHPLRIRLYTTVALRNADVSRPVSNFPSPGSGLLFEGVTTLALPQFDTGPVADAFNNEATVTNLIAYTLDPSTPVNTTATITYMVIQA